MNNHQVSSLIQCQNQFKQDHTVDSDIDLNDFQNFKQDFQIESVDHLQTQPQNLNAEQQNILKSLSGIGDEWDLISESFPSKWFTHKNELTNSLFWFSLLEFALFIFSMLLFFTDPTEMVYIWMHLLHFSRGALGLTLMKKLPKSYQMAQNMSIPSGDQMSFEAIMNYMLLAARDALKDFTSSTKKWLIFYFVNTVLCLFLDLVQFFIQVKDFGRVQSAFADLSMVIIASIFLYIDWYYILWIVSLQYKFPSYIALSFTKSTFGIMESLHQKLGEYLVRQKMEQEARYRAESQKYDYVNQYNQQRNNQRGSYNYPQPQLDTSHG